MNNAQTNYKAIPGFPNYETNQIGQIRRIGSEFHLATSTNSGGYLQMRVDGQSLRPHRAVALTFLGVPQDPTLVVNHKDADRKNNHVSNLEWISNRENVSAGYLLKPKSSKYIGVCWNKSRVKWTASAKIDGRKKFFGYFVSEEEAREAYLKGIADNGVTNKYTRSLTRFELFKNKIASLWN
jgi:hypothetical protein